VGFGLQKQLAAEGSRIPVLFITGRGDPSTRGCARQAGAVDYLRKPLDEEVLLAAIQRAVDC
jgi:FixJ family two-component response regulator